MAIPEQQRIKPTDLDGKKQNTNLVEIEMDVTKKRDSSKPAEEQGVFHKFDVRRVDGSDQPGGKHHGCRYFVLDLDHDPHAAAAMAAYAKSCRATHPALSDELSVEYPPNTVDASTVDRAGARFCGAFGDGSDAPYPGMIAAFEIHYGQSFQDKAWRTEAACWAAAWHKATEQAAKTKPLTPGE